MQRTCECEICKNCQEFILPDGLLADFLEGRVSIIAGAGISTESKAVLKHTFFEDVADELNLRHPSLPFPDLMEKYCRLPNGRYRLLDKIKARFDHIDSFPELNRSATKFHRELGTFFPVRNIVTTNWDVYFEEHCRATPFITDPDLAFWEAANRRVLKLHGSITNLGSIVATACDYKTCQERMNIGVLGGVLKTLLATQTIVFIGYSLSDFDFSAIYEFVTTQMGSMRKQSYVVTPDPSEEERFRKAGLIPVITDGTHFLNQIKKHAVAKGYMLDDEMYDAASDLLERVRLEHRKLHRKFELSSHPELIYAASYQDGIMHALERVIELRGSGLYSQTGRNSVSIKGYLNWKKEKRRLGMYEDVAYIDGYVNALTYLLMNPRERKEVGIPFYYAFGINAVIFTLDDFRRALNRWPAAHKASLRRARRFSRRLSPGSSVEFHHLPWL